MSKPRYYDPQQFAFTEVLERNWKIIRDEYEGVRDKLADYVERKLYDQGWQVLALYAFPHGEPIPENIACCPRTAEWVRELFPRHGAAGYSRMNPGTEIRPHEGYRGSFLRLHLGLRIPEGDCGISVEGETRKWQEGRVLILDDRLPHEAWNRTDQERVILLLDFVPDWE